MKWIRASERLPTEDDADWDGLITVYSGSFRRMLKLHQSVFGVVCKESVWWLEGYRTEKPEPPEE